MTHAVQTQHDDYTDQLPTWKENAIALCGQHAVKATGKMLLPATSGMKKWKEKNSSDDIYLAYQRRARVSDIPQESLEGALGVLFGKDPSGSIDEMVTNDKLTIKALARQVVSAVYSKGRHVLVVDSGADRVPYITQYSAESFINWRVDGNGMLTLAVFREQVPDPGRDEFSHDTVDQYRVYTPGLVRVFNNEGVVVENHETGLQELPVVVIGSVNCSPVCDRAPITRIVECTLAAYRNSADYQQGMFLTAQPTLWSGGMTIEQWKQNNSLGIGAGAHHYLGPEQFGRMGYAEFTGAGIAALKTSVDDELATAADYAVKLAHVNGVEAAEAKQIRDTAQKSALSMMADSVAEGINVALEMLRERSVSPRRFEPFEFNMQSQAQAEATMIAAIGNRVSMGGYPAVTEYNYAVKSDLFSGTYKEWQDEINTGGNPALMNNRPSPLDDDSDDRRAAA